MFYRPGALRICGEDGFCGAGRAGPYQRGQDESTELCEVKQVRLVAEPPGGRDR